MNLEFSAEEFEFAQRVRDFLDENLPAHIAEAVRLQTATWVEKDIALEWQGILHKKGWLAYGWPEAFGGTGWSPIQRFIFERECALAGAPELVAMGLRYVGPVIFTFGSDAQQSFFLPRILNGEHYWAQGFSEPGAGSDLAALKCRAELEGDQYVVNGSKMWTTHAHFANWLFCLVRTRKADRPQLRISFLLIDLESPGVKIDPIPTIGVDLEVNQVFMENVRVPKENLVGQEGRGWDYAKFLLEFERGGSTFSGRLRRELNHVKCLIDENGKELWSDRVLVHRLARLEFRLMALEVIELRIFSAQSTGQPPGNEASALKLLATELQQDITEMGVEVSGLAGLELETNRPLYTQASGEAGHGLSRMVMSRYLNMRAASIYGGSSEIQREIIAKHVLGLR